MVYIPQWRGVKSFFRCCAKKVETGVKHFLDRLLQKFFEDTVLIDAGLAAFSDSEIFFIKFIRIVFRNKDRRVRRTRLSFTVVRLVGEGNGIACISEALATAFACWLCYGMDKIHRSHI